MTTPPPKLGRHFAAEQLARTVVSTAQRIRHGHDPDELYPILVKRNADLFDVDTLAAFLATAQIAIAIVGVNEANDELAKDLADELAKDLADYPDFGSTVEVLALMVNNVRRSIDAVGIDPRHHVGLCAANANSYATAELSALLATALIVLARSDQAVAIIREEVTRYATGDDHQTGRPRA